MSTITDARRLGEHFAAVEREPGVSRDAFIDPSSKELVANLLLTAACSGRDILAGYRWAVSPRDDEPAMLPREHGFAQPADAVSGVVNMPDKIRGGIYAGAQKMLMCLTEPAVTAWVTPPTRGGVLELDPAAFVVSTDVLYLLSQGGPGSPAPLVAALTDAVLRAGELRAPASAGRRLDPPLLSILDEAANICRLRQLPNLYSYYGSHGLPIGLLIAALATGGVIIGPLAARITRRVGAERALVIGVAAHAAAWPIIATTGSSWVAAPLLAAIGACQTLITTVKAGLR